MKLQKLMTALKILSKFPLKMQRKIENSSKIEKSRKKRKFMKKEEIHEKHEEIRENSTMYRNSLYPRKIDVKISLFMKNPVHSRTNYSVFHGDIGPSIRLIQKNRYHAFV